MGGAERVRREAAARREGPKGKGAPDPAALPTVVVCSQSSHPPFDRFVGGPSYSVTREHEQSAVARTHCLHGAAIGYGIGTYRAALVAIDSRRLRSALSAGSLRTKRSKRSGRRGRGCVPSACD